MKKFVFVVGIALLFCFSSCSQDFSIVSESDVNSEKVKIAENFANSYLTKLKEGNYYQFQDEAIDVFINQLTEQNQKSIYQNIKRQFGDFVGLEYAETWEQGSHPQIRIYRFKSEFEKSNKKLELRVVLNESNKIVGFWIKPWVDMLK